MTEEEYRRLFTDVQEKEQNGFGVSENNIPQQQTPYQNLNEINNQNQWQRLNETPDVSQYQIDENVNGGWGTNDIQVETRVNGIEQQHNTSPFQQRRRNPRGGKNLNGLDDYIDDDISLNEVIKQPTQIINETQPNVDDVDVVSIEMFESMNQRGLMNLHSNIFK